MDAETRDYRRAQFKRLGKDNEYKPTLKLISDNGETNWMSLTPDELAKVKEALTK